MPTNNFGINFKYRTKYYKLMDIQWGNDNSFYFIPLQSDADIGKRLKSNINNSSGVVSFTIDEIEEGHFPLRKISRHPSGFYHVKDEIGKGGRREKDGLRGVAFQDINGLHACLIIIPQSIDTLVEVSTPAPEDVIMNLPDEIEPFAIEFFIWDKNTQIEIPIGTDRLLGDGVLAIEHKNLNYGMIVVFLKFKKASPDIIARFPKKTAYLMQ